MAKNYTITFVSLRAATTYTLHIGGGSGDSVPLKGGAQPFVTQEEETDDQYTPVRTHIGYLRILDNGLDANGNAWDWKDLVPDSDTARPVTLTHVSGNDTVIDWIGFMQAQDFGSVLYGNPQEREFPVQCVLSVTQGTDINYTQKEIQNFAYLLKQIVDAIPSDQRPTNYVIQGGEDAQAWLLKQIDWQNFCTTDDEGNISARFTMYECLEDVCRFWGWTARTYQQTMYLTCTDDQVEQKLLKLTYEQLATMAGGTAAGTTTDDMADVSLSGDIFASIENHDYLVRGVNNAQVQVNGNRADKYLVDLTADKFEKLLKDQGWNQTPIVDDGKFAYYTNDLLSFTMPLLKGNATTNYGSFNMARLAPNAMEEGDYYSEIRIKKSYDSEATTGYVSLETVYQHAFDDGYFQMLGETFRLATKYEDVTEQQKNIGDYFGNKTMYMRIGIGASRAAAKWYNGTSWGDEVTAFKATIGNANEYIGVVSNSGNFRKTKIAVDSLKGYLYIDFFGSNDMPEKDGQRSFEIADFQVTFTRTESRNVAVSGKRSSEQIDRNNVRIYKAKNENKVRGDYNADCIYGSDNDMEFGYGVLINQDGSYMNGLTYGESTVPEYPEQHLANRVVEYWSTPKRKIECELKANAIATIDPGTLVTIDATLTHPIAICRDWYDDLVRFVLLEMPDTENEETTTI